MMIDDLPDKKSADLDLRYGPEMLRTHHGILPAVANEYRVFFQSDRANGMKLAGNIMVLKLFRLIDIAIPMVLINAESEYKADPVIVTVRESTVIKQGRNRIAALFDRKDGTLTDPVGAQIAVTGGDQRVRIHIDRTAFFVDASCKAAVEGLVRSSVIVVRIDIVPAHISRSKRPRKAGIEKTSAYARNRTRADGFQDHAAESGPV